MSEERSARPSRRDFARRLFRGFAARAADGRAAKIREAAMTRPRRAVLLVNLGSPAAPTSREVVVFLEQFLADPRVVDLPPWLWSFLRRRVILPRRSARVAEAYASVWTKEGSDRKSTRLNSSHLVTSYAVF